MKNEYTNNTLFNNFINKIDSNYNLNDILKINKGKKVVIYQSFNNIEENNNLNGIIENCGDDYVILSNPNSGNWYLILIKSINFIKFEEEINFNI